ncbi:hypothetical protein LSCM1_01349 [Leishmania martiniquensis]|uniref:Uncharacterized protein n=1 Tax=Leishmania martiniquensis TaxID=1580590 RepID=A0A836KES0_9TRYP|nr:hypothetical protein LSCM1_01349 [Leishmania martiniquensis]
MLRGASLLRLRVLCLTMLPDGGALTPALRKLGYTPYTLCSTYQQGHARTHPIEWSKLLDGKTTALPPKVLADYDAVVGPPGAMAYDVLLRQAPSYTKVILVEETDKDRWAEEYDAYLKRLQLSTRRASRNRIVQAFEVMMRKMVVDDDASGAAMAAAADSASSRRAEKSWDLAMSSVTTLRRSLAAEAAKLKRGFRESEALSTTNTDDLGEHSGGTASAQQERQERTSEASDGRLQRSRAVALQLYEDSVRMSIPPSSLLVYRYGDGWEPLCTFLDKPTPSVPFPAYENGLRALGRLQERIDRAYTLQYVVGFICALWVIVTMLPHCEGLLRFMKDLYTDYRVAFGSDDAVPAWKVAGGDDRTQAANSEAT